MSFVEADRIILDLCGGTGAWSRPYLEAGYDVRNVTLPGDDVRSYSPPEGVYGILAAPPCTMFSLARSTPGKLPRDFRGAMEIVEACLKIIWKCRLAGALEFWCLENPRGFLRQFLGKPVFTFDPWEFGDGYAKKTDLWGFFNIPKVKIVRWGEKYPGISQITSGSQAVKRAITPPGFARAFFKANP